MVSVKRPHAAMHMQVPAGTPPDPSLAAIVAGDIGAYLGTDSPWVTVGPVNAGPDLALAVNALFPENDMSGSGDEAGSLAVGRKNLDYLHEVLNVYV